jgi:hypothetical protein
VEAAAVQMVGRLSLSRRRRCPPRPRPSAWPMHAGTAPRGRGRWGADLATIAGRRARTRPRTLPSRARARARSYSAIVILLTIGGVDPSVLTMTTARVSGAAHRLRCCSTSAELRAGFSSASASASQGSDDARRVCSSAGASGTRSTGGEVRGVGHHYGIVGTGLDGRKREPPAIAGGRPRMPWVHHKPRPNDPSVADGDDDYMGSTSNASCTRR